jgi:hypothetical protein
MKIFIAAFLFVSIYFNSFSQKIELKDLIGTSWLINHDAYPSDTSMYTFIDSSELYYHYSFTKEKKSGKELFDYTFDNSGNSTLLFLYSKHSDIIIGDYCFIKMKDNNTIILQWAGRDKPQKWNKSKKDSWILSRVN